MPVIPATPLEQFVQRFLTEPLLNSNITLERLFANGGGSPGARGAFSQWVSSQIAAPSRNTIHRMLDVAGDKLERGVLEGDPLAAAGPAAWARSTLDAGREGMGMMDRQFQLRRMYGGQVNGGFKDFFDRYGLKADSPELLDIRRAVEAGDLSNPAARDWKALADWSKETLTPHLSPNEAALQQHWNPLPVIVDAGAARLNPLVYNEYAERLANRVIQGSPELTALAKEALNRPEDAVLLHHEVANLIRENVMESGTTQFRPVQGYVRSPAKVMMRRLATDIPEELRMHPYAEMMHGLHDEAALIADSASFGRNGERLQTIIDLLQGKLSPEQYQNLPKEMLQQVQEMRRQGLIDLPVGDVQHGIGDMLDRLAQASTGASREQPWVWGLRSGFAPVAQMVMMSVSAIPRIVHGLVDELIVRGGGPVLKGFVQGDQERARMLGILVGQTHAAMLPVDYLGGMDAGTRLLAGGAKMKGPIESLRAGEVPSLLNPRWWVENYNLIKDHGLKGLKAVSDRHLAAIGFSGADDWARRGGILAVEDEFANIQARLKANPGDAYALRRMRGFGFDDPERFLAIKPPRTSEELSGALNDFWHGDIGQRTQIQDWQRAYWHGMGQTQFNFMPGDLPLAFSHPLAGGVVLQLRRFTYLQAQRVMGHILTELSAGNPVPLLYAAVTIPTGGEVVKRVKDLLQLRNVAFVDGQPIQAERPPVQGAEKVRLPWGGVMTVDQRRQMENALATGLLGIYGDAISTLGEGNPTLLSAWALGIFPQEMINLVTKLAGATAEVTHGPEPVSGYSRFGGPRVEAAVRQVVHEVPFWGRLLAPQVRWDNAKYQQLREFGMRTFYQGNFDAFDKIQQVLTEGFYSPLTLNDITSYGYRQAMKEAGYGQVAPRPGEPAYPEYLAREQAEGRLLPRGGRRPAERGMQPEIEQKIKTLEERFRHRTGLPGPEEQP